MKILTIAGSLRKDSLNKKLLNNASSVALKKGTKITNIDLLDYDAPLYSGDIEEKQGVPASITRLKKQFDTADAVIIASPEYNFSASGVLKNIIDWLSRTPKQPFKKKHILLMSASPSMVGGNRGLWALRVPLEALGAFVYPEMFSLANAHMTFDKKGVIKDEQLLKTLKSNVESFVTHVTGN